MCADISAPVRDFPAGFVPAPTVSPVGTEVVGAGSGLGARGSETLGMLWRMLSRVPSPEPRAPAGIVRWRRREDYHAWRPPLPSCSCCTARFTSSVLPQGIRLGRMSQLTQSISQAQGVLWLASALLFTVTATALFVWPRGWWLIRGRRHRRLDARDRSVVGRREGWRRCEWGIVALGLVLGCMSEGPLSLRAEYEADVQRYASNATALSPVTEADLAHLPPPVQRYLHVAGVVGQPRVSSFHVRMHGRIREGAQHRWMPLRTEQYNAVRPAARLFYLTATMFAIPVHGYHRYVGASASMRVKAAALVTVAAADGPEMTHGKPSPCSTTCA